MAKLGPQFNRPGWSDLGGGNAMYESGNLGQNDEWSESSTEVRKVGSGFKADSAVFTDEGDELGAAVYKTPYRAMVAAEGIESRLTAGKSLPPRVEHTVY
jgi:hypothetical protein